MKRYIFFLIALLCLPLHPWPAWGNIFQKYAKVIWINQEEQVGAAYGRGQKLLEFPILTGDDETPTPPGTYVIKSKVRDYHSRKYDTPMPYSLFFDYRGRAIHEGGVPDPGEHSEWATHGCIHVEQPYMEWLYNWAETGSTVVVVKGRRVWDEELVKKADNRRIIEEIEPSEESGAPQELEETRESDDPRESGKDED
jgi:hypothetical protein